MKINDFLTEMPELLDQEDGEDFRDRAQTYIAGMSIEGNNVVVADKYEKGELPIIRRRGDWVLANGQVTSKYGSKYAKKVTYLVHQTAGEVDFYASIILDGADSIYQDEVAKGENSTTNAKDMFMGIAWAAKNLGKNYVRSSDTQTIGGQKLWYKWLAMAQSLGLETGYFIVGEDDAKPLPEDENPEKWFKKVFASKRLVPYFKLG